MAKTQQDIQENIRKICSKIHTTQLIAVTKNQSPETLNSLLLIPEVQHIGENKWQDFQERFLEAHKGKNQTNLYKQFKRQGIEFHFIGHLQTNKVKYILPYFDLIHSVDSIKLLEKINTEAEKINKIQHTLLEVNISQDELKHGFSPKEIEKVITHASTLPQIQINGFMTILKQGLTSQAQRKYFKQLADLSAQYNLPETSMGMSQDYEIATSAGATMIRVGSAIFSTQAPQSN